MTLFNGNPVDMKAYNEGEKAYVIFEKSGRQWSNPYPVQSDQWHSWNKGWNSVNPEEEPVKVITDFQLTEVSLMPDGSFAMGGYIKK